jgi:hypothetical protein
MSKQQGGKTPTPNDQRSVVKNPNNPAHTAATDNRGNQLNPNHTTTNPPAKTGGGGSADGKKA